MLRLPTALLTQTGGTAGDRIGGPDMASIEYSVEIGAWVESDTPKATGKGFRKVWVAGDAGEESRLSVIARTEGKPERHLVTLHVGDADARDIASHVLTLALQGVQAYGEHAGKPAKAAAPKPAPKVPTPPKVLAPAEPEREIAKRLTAPTPAPTPSRVVHADVCK